MVTREASPGPRGGVRTVPSADFGPLALAVYPRVAAALAKDASGHDLAHVLRVRTLALRLAAAEDADPVVVELIALLHDVGSPSGRAEHGARGAALARTWLEEAHAGPDLAKRVVDAIAALSWSTGRTPDSLEGRLVQDADRLDAIGAVGIGRAFAYGGAHGQGTGLPAAGVGPAAGTTVAHFAEKLLRLTGHLHTQAARRLAQGRHAFLVAFLERLDAEAVGEA